MATIFGRRGPPLHRPLIGFTAIRIRTDPQCRPWARQRRNTKHYNVNDSFDRFDANLLLTCFVRICLALVSAFCSLSTNCVNDWLVLVNFLPLMFYSEHIAIAPLLAQHFQLCACVLLICHFVTNRDLINPVLESLLIQFLTQSGVQSDGKKCHAERSAPQSGQPAAALQSDWRHNATSWRVRIK